MARLSLDRILQSQGVGTRKWCRELIGDGEVAIGGEVVTDYKASYDTGGLVFTLFDDEWIVREHVYIVINKPPNIECSRKPSHHPGVLTLLPERLTTGVVALMFGIGAVMLLREGFGAEEDSEQDAARSGAAEVSFRRSALTSFGVLFAAEWGDASQLATAGLTAHYGHPFAVGIGAWLALVAVAGVAVLIGRKIRDRVRPQLIQRIAGFVFSAFTLVAVYQTIEIGRAHV